jgi:CheY-like chemotaxis protein
VSNPPGPVDRGAARTVLVIEDNRDARDALVTLLQIDGYAVEAAPDGVEGLRLAHDRRFDVALIDIGLPGLDGYEVAKQMRALDQDPPYLIALTGYGEPEDQRRAKEAGFDAHLVKPVDPDRLTALISRETPGRESPG